MKKVYILQSHLNVNKIAITSIQDTAMYLKKLFEIEYQSQMRLNEEMQDKFYEIKLYEVTTKKGNLTKSPVITIKPSDFRKWTGKDIPEIKTRQDFLKLFSFIEDKYLYLKK